MDFTAVFQFLLDIFKREKIEFALIGGFALQAVGVTRTTQDIDLIILAKDAARIKDIMVQAGYELLHESEDVLNFLSKSNELGKVDFLLAHRKYALAMLKRAKEKEMLGGKFKIKVLELEDLIGLKVQSSSNNPDRLHQDMADIEMMIKNNYPKINLGLLREYFNLFDRENELNEIMVRVKHA